MTTLTVGSAAPLATKTVQPTRTVQPKMGLFARAWAAFVEARTLQAERAIAQHEHLLPVHLEQAGNRLGRSEKNLPFAR